MVSYVCQDSERVARETFNVTSTLISSSGTCQLSFRSLMPSYELSNAERSIQVSRFTFYAAPWHDSAQSVCAS